MRTTDITSLAQCVPFSDFLPYVAYDPETKLYVNSDDSVGYMWECTPHVYAGDRSKAVLEGLFWQELPDEAVMQFILYADDYIDPILERYRSRKTRDLPIIKEMVSHITEFMKENTKGLSGLQNIPLRNFRLFVAIRMPGDKMKRAEDRKILDTVYTSCKEKLTGAHLHPRDFTPEDLFDWLRRFMNDEPSLNNRHYDDSVAIKKQIIFADTLIENHVDHIKVGNKYLRCATVKTYPEEVNLMQTNELFGGIWGGISDTSQITTPFMFTLSCLIDHGLKDRLQRKTEFYTKQPAFGSFAKTIATIKEEYHSALHNIAAGMPYVRIMPTIWVWGSSEERSSASLARVKRMWEEKGYIMQSDKVILPILLVTSLPFGTYTKAKIFDILQRDFPVPAGVAVNLLPTQADFSGSEPAALYVGRKGQLAGMNIYSKEGVNNSNTFIVATSGAGKSFMVNYLVTNHYGENAMIRIIDIGRSYNKMTHLFGARFLDFDETSKLSLNPFTNIKPDTAIADIPVIGTLVADMCFAKTDIVPFVIAETANTLTKKAAEWAWKTQGNDSSIDDMYEYLKQFPDLCGDEDVDKHSADMQDIARTLAFNLQDFTSKGNYGRWFNGPSTFDISNDEFVVLELENLKAQKTLWNIITMQVINAVTQDLYLSDRSRQKMIIFDEAYQFIKDGSALREVIGEGYRRARKYNGSFSIVTQSILDLQIFGEVGHVIMANSAWKFFLEAHDFDKALSEKLISYEPFIIELIKSIKSNRPKYSEIFSDTPVGMGPLRLAVDAYSYYLFTSDASEIAEIETMLGYGMTYDEAIREMMRLHPRKGTEVIPTERRRVAA